MSILELIKKRNITCQKKAREKAFKNVAIGAAVGAAVGATAGVLLAPKSGKETRDDLVRATNGLPEKAKEIIEKTKEKVEEVKGKLKEKQTKSIECLEVQ